MIKIWAAEAKIRQLFIQKHWILHFPWCNFITPSLIPFLPGWYSHLHTSVYTFCNFPFVVSSAKLNPDDIIFTSSRGFFFFLQSQRRHMSKSYSCLWILRNLLTSWWSDVAPQYPACLCSAGPSPWGAAARRWGRKWSAERASGGSCQAVLHRGRSTPHSQPRSSGPRNLEELLIRQTLTWL